MNNKGISEIISQILLLLITVIVIGIIIGALVPQITRSQSRLNFEESKRVRDNIYSNIQEVYNSPIGYTKEINFSLENLTLVIDADTNSIEVYSLIDGDFYKDGLRQDETLEKYTYRRGQKVYAGFTLSNINLVRSYVLENVTRTSIYLRKTDKEKITVLLENVTEDSWFTSSNLGLYTENPSTWQYRKKILIDGNKVDGNLTNFPVLIYLEDEDLRDYANADGNDIIFTLGDGKTKLKREIESYGVRNEYEYRKKITIDSDKVDGDLTDFPVLISLKDQDLFTKARSDGKDIYFKDELDNVLKREIESYQDVTTYRKKITIDKDKVEEDLTDFPVLISLRDQNLSTIAKEDGSDIFFTLPDGTRLKREIESFEDVTTYKKKITIDSDKVDEDLTDFPMLVSVKDSDLKNYAKEDGSDIFFTLPDETRLKREIESFEDVNTYRKKITIDKDKVDEDLTDFPMLVSLTDSNLATFAKADGSDIYFTLPDGTRLKREIEDYNSVTGALVSWVKIPNLSSTVNTDIYINFGDEDENNSNDVDMWDENFVGVYLFNNNVLDSSIYGNHATLNNGSYTYNSQFGKSLSFNANNTKLELPNNFYVDTNRPFSILTRFKSFGYNNQIYQRLISLKTTSSPFMIGLSNNATYSGIYFGSRLGEFYLGKTETIPEINVWHNLVWIYLGENATNSDNYLVYLDGNLIAHTPISGTPSINDNTNNLIGSRTVAGDIQYVIDGELLNFKISNNIYSESWIKTEYNNQSAPETFSSVGELETITTKELIAWVKVPNLSSTVDTNIYMHFGNASENNTNDTDVWDSNYLFVQHFNDNVIDSTINTNDGTIAGSPTYVDGIVGKGLQFNGNPDSVTINYSEDLSGTGNFSVSAWVKYTGNQSYVIAQSHALPPNTYASDWFFPFSSSIFWMRSGVVGSATTINDDGWHQITMVWDKSIEKYKGYVDGQLVAESNTISGYGGTGTIKIGARGDLTTTFFIGAVDNIKVSNSIRSAEWIKTEYNNQSAPETFSSVGELETTTTKELIAWIKVPSLSSTTDTEIYINFGEEYENNVNDTNVQSEDHLEILPFTGELETINDRKQLIAWVKIPNLSSTTDTNIYMYFGDGTERENDTDVWDNNFVLVHHFDDLLDSTINENNGTNYGAALVDGKIGTAYDFNGINNYISIDNDTSLNPGTNDFTISLWVKFGYKSGNVGVLTKGYSPAYGVFYTPSINNNISLYVQSGASYTGMSMSPYYDQWTYVTWRVDNANNIQRSYLNGEFDNQKTNAVGNVTSEFNINLGRYSSNGTGYFKGTIDEPRISNSLRSEQWIKTEYNNQSSPETFSSTGELETITTPHKELYAWVKIPELITGEDTALYMYFGNSDANESNDKDVWDEDFAVVHHFNNNFLDSTINNINGVVTGTITPVADRFNNLNAFSFASGYVTIPKPFNQNNLEQVWTVDAWFKLKTKNSTQTLLHRGSFNAGCHFIWGSTQNPLLYLNSGSVNDYYTYGNGNAIYTDTWQKITYIFRNSDGHRKIYINGIDITTSGPNASSTPAGITSTINIGDLYTGDLDDVKISKIARSEEWIKTEYTNQSTPEEFVKVGILEKA